MVKYIDITGLKDLTIAAKAKTTGGVSCSIQLYTDGALNAALTGANKDNWCEVKYELNFETLTYVSYKDGKEVTKGELKPIADKSKLDIRFFQTIDNTKCTYWDDIMITTSGEKLDESTASSPALVQSPINAKVFRMRNGQKSKPGSTTALKSGITATSTTENTSTACSKTMLTLSAEAPKRWKCI